MVVVVSPLISQTGIRDDHPLNSRIMYDCSQVRRTRICLLASLAEIVPVCSSKRSLKVLLPWSICATMQKFRYRSIGMAAMRASSSAGDGFADDGLAGAAAYARRKGIKTCRVRVDLPGSCRGRVQALAALQAQVIYMSVKRRALGMPVGFDGRLGTANGGMVEWWKWKCKEKERL